MGNPFGMTYNLGDLTRRPPLWHPWGRRVLNRNRLMYQKRVAGWTYVKIARQHRRSVTLVQFVVAREHRWKMKEILNALRQASVAVVRMKQEALK
jgi:hypothetical protein